MDCYHLLIITPPVDWWYIYFILWLYCFHEVYNPIIYDRRYIYKFVAYNNLQLQFTTIKCSSYRGRYHIFLYYYKFNEDIIIIIITYWYLVIESSLDSTLWSAFKLPIIYDINFQQTLNQIIIWWVIYIYKRYI